MKVVSVTGHFDLKVAKAFQSATLSFFPLAVGPRILPDLALVGVQLHCDDEITSYHIHLLTMSNFHLRLPLSICEFPIQRAPPHPKCNFRFSPTHLFPTRSTSFAKVSSTLLHAGTFLTRSLQRCSKSSTSHSNSSSLPIEGSSRC
jgi:hypothetical protein